MKVGFVGLGKMGSQMVARLVGGRHQVVAYDTDPRAVRRAKLAGAHPAGDLSDVVGQLGERPVIWLMIPSAYVGQTIDELLPLLPRGAILVDGGNTDYRQTLQHYSRCRSQGVELVDVGTSGGVLGLHDGFSMMVGGTPGAFAVVEPLVKTLAQPEGYRHFGQTGTGHYVKMVHNAVEYGVMEAYAEGYQLLREGPFPGIRLADVAEIWQHGSVIASNLNHIAGKILRKHPNLTITEGRVAETGEAQWAIEVAREHAVPMPAVEVAIEVRAASQKGKTSFATKLLAALRHAFGGHPL